MTKILRIIHPFCYAIYMNQYRHNRKTSRQLEIVYFHLHLIDSIEPGLVLLFVTLNDKVRRSFNKNKAIMDRGIEAPQLYFWYHEKNPASLQSELMILYLPVYNNSISCCVNPVLSIIIVIAMPN